jgi:hypothetical protein
MEKTDSRLIEEVEHVRRIQKFQRGFHPRPAIGEIWTLIDSPEVRLLVLDVFGEFVRVARTSTEISFAGPRDIILDARVINWCPTLIELFAACWIKSVRLDQCFYGIPSELLRAIQAADRGMQACTPPGMKKGEVESIEEAEFVKGRWREGRRQLMNRLAIPLPELVGPLEARHDQTQ